MKAIHPATPLQDLCDLFGKTRQAYYKQMRRGNTRAEFHRKVLDEVKLIRARQPRIGTKKLQYLINKKLEPEGLVIGRDALYDLLRAHGMLIRVRKKYRPVLTNGNGESIYPDFRKSLITRGINELWSSDITYIDLNTSARHCYATFVIDEHSHLIVGYEVSESMKASEVIMALKKAVKSQAPEAAKFAHKLIFHTDRGSQYKSALFARYLAKSEIRMSMCEQGKSSENPVAERLNGVMKNELMLGNSFNSFEQARDAIDRAVLIYNTERPHMSNEMLTPQEAHHPEVGALKRLWKPRKKKQYATNHT